MLVNILNVGIPFVTLFCLLYIAVNLFGAKEPENIRFNFAFYWLFILLFCMFCFALINNWQNTSQIAYHFNVLIALLFGKITANDPKVEFKVPYYLIWFYLITSFLIYFFAWDFFASLTYSQEGNLGLTTNGLKRSYGLLFNPLANAYFLLIVFFMSMAVDEKEHMLFKLVVLFSIFLALTRGAMVSLALFIALYLFYRRKWLYILICVLLVLISYYTLEPVQIIIDSIITLEDSQGSAQGHEESMVYAIDIMLDNPFGVGFANKHTESWVLNYGMFYGFMGLIVIISYFSYIAFKLLLKKKGLFFILFVSFLPVTLIIPFHTFNLPIVLFFVFTYFLYYRKIAFKPKA